MNSYFTASCSAGTRNPSGLYDTIQFTAEKGGIVLAQNRSSPQRKEELFQRKVAVHRREKRNCFIAEPQFTGEKGEIVSRKAAIRRRERKNCFNAKPQFTAEKGEIVSTQSRNAPQRREKLFQRKAAKYRKANNLIRGGLIQHQVSTSPLRS